jgi:hypothetical protein
MMEGWHAQEQKDDSNLESFPILFRCSSCIFSHLKRVSLKSNIVPESSCPPKTILNNVFSIYRAIHISVIQSSLTMKVTSHQLDNKGTNHEKALFALFA